MKQKREETAFPTASKGKVSTPKIWMATVKTLTINQAAELLDISISKIYADIKKGIITPDKNPSGKFVLSIEDIKTVYGNFNPQDLEILDQNLDNAHDMPSAFNKSLVISILRQENKALTEQNKLLLENQKIALENSKNLQLIIAENQAQLLQLLTEGFHIFMGSKQADPKPEPEPQS